MQKGLSVHFLNQSSYTDEVELREVCQRMATEDRLKSLSLDSSSQFTTNLGALKLPGDRINEAMFLIWLVINLPESR